MVGFLFFFFFLKFFFLDSTPDSLYVDANATFEQKERCASVVAHEIAHNWFGNLVTIGLTFFVSELIPS